MDTKNAACRTINWTAFAEQCGNVTNSTLSIDCGTWNFAYCVIDENGIKHMDLVDIKTRIKSAIYKKMNSIESYTICINNLLDEIFNTHNCNEVLIERQMINNSKCAVIMSAIIQYCIHKQITYVIVSPKLKGNISIGKLLFAQKSDKPTKWKSYAINKQSSKFDIIDCLNIDISKFKKKDDICDTIMQYYGHKYANKQLTLCDCNIDVTDQIRAICLTTNEKEQTKNNAHDIKQIFANINDCCKLWHLINCSH